MATLNQEMDLKYVKAMIKKKNENKPKPRLRALVIVLGDIGHSPRMQYHVASLAKEGFDVDFVGFRHSEPRAEILKHSAVDIKALEDCPSFFRGFPRLLFYAVKVLWLVISIFVELSKLKTPQVILIQNPPTIPVVFCILLANYFWQAGLVIDWHNYSHTIFAIANKKRGLFQKIALSVLEFSEKITAQAADLNLCVTKAMAIDIKQRWHADAITLYDRPPEDFGSLDSLEARHFLFMKLGGVCPPFRSSVTTSTGPETVFTRKDLGKPAELKDNRPALLVSSTSWTEDEDFGILFDALKIYDQAARKAPEMYPKILLVVTGKGPLKEFYMGKVKNEPLEMVAITSFWLENADYPRLLGSADLGVCLHYSSSGLDLPMKVVDMFGCGIPVCAVEYNCIDELVQQNINGLLFKTPEELCGQLLNLLEGFPNLSRPLLHELKHEVQTFRQSKWHANWTSVAKLPVVSLAENRRQQKVKVSSRIVYAVVGLFLLILPFLLATRMAVSILTG